MATARVTVYRALKDGECHIIALSESAAREMLDRYHGYRPEEAEAWSVEATTEDIPVVDGSYADWGSEDDPLPHVSWECPACGQTHHTDVESGEPNPSLWYCASGFGRSGRRSRSVAIFLVRWLGLERA